jgi:hypothetical protein
MYSEENDFNIKNQGIGADGNEEILIDNKANDINQI